MDLKIDGRYFIVGGAGSGFGRAISVALAKEGALVLAVSRTKSKLQSLCNLYPEQIELLCGDISDVTIQNEMTDWATKNHIDGIVVNSGGPPAGGFSEISMKQWDDAYYSVLKWKIELSKAIMPIFEKQQYGRLLFIESISVKQPVPNLILSNVMRPAVVGLVKTMSRQYAGAGITLNVLAPGYHSTAAIERLFIKKSELSGITIEEAKQEFEAELPIKPMGEAEEIANLALWLLSPLSRFVTGQTISHDGGMVDGLFG